MGKQLPHRRGVRRGEHRIQPAFILKGILRAWMRNEHHDDIKKMQALTKVDALKLLLNGVDHLPVLTISAQS
jgi:hypothetical protein